MREDYSKGKINSALRAEQQKTQSKKQVNILKHPDTQDTHGCKCCQLKLICLRKKKLEDSSEKLAWRRDAESETETMSICHFTSPLSENTDMFNPTARFTQEGCGGRPTAREEGGGEAVDEQTEALTFLVCCVHRKQADREKRSRERKD